MAHPSGAPEGRPSDPRDLIFEIDRESQPSHIRRKERWHLPARVALSITTGGLLAGAYRLAAELVVERFEPVFPGWTFYVALGVCFLFGSGAMYRWLNKT